MVPRVQQGLPERQDRHRDADLRPDARQAGVVVPVVLDPTYDLIIVDNPWMVDFAEREVPAAAGRPHRQHHRLRRGRLLPVADRDHHGRRRPLRRAVLQLCARIPLQHRRSGAGASSRCRRPSTSWSARPRRSRSVTGRASRCNRSAATRSSRSGATGCSPRAARSTTPNGKVSLNTPQAKQALERLHRHLPDRRAAEQPELGLRRGVPVGVQPARPHR